MKSMILMPALLGAVQAFAQQPPAGSELRTPQAWRYQLPGAVSQVPRGALEPPFTLDPKVGKILTVQTDVLKKLSTRIDELEARIKELEARAARQGR